MAENTNNQAAEATQGAWNKFRAFVKKHKSAIIAGFTGVVCWLAGDGTISSAIQIIWQSF